MKKLFFLLILINFTLLLNSYEFTLKEKIWTKNEMIRLQEVIIEKLPGQVGEIIITQVKKSPHMIKAHQILQILFDHQIIDVSLAGKQTYIFSDRQPISPLSDQGADSRQNRHKNPLIDLENFYNHLFPDQSFQFKIKVKTITPRLDLKTIDRDYHWEIKKIKNIWQDIKNLNSMNLIVRQKKYQVELEVALLADIWIAKQSIRKDELFSSRYFYSRKIDVTHLKEIKHLIFNINELKNTAFANNMEYGDILRWTDLIKTPLIKKGENTKVKIIHQNMQIMIPCTALQNGFENKTIKIKLRNGTQKIGTVRQIQGDCYVQIL